MKQRPKNSYRVMTKDLEAYKLSGNNLEEMKQYCRNDDVIVMLKAKFYGFKLRVIFTKPEKFLRFRKLWNTVNISYMHISFNIEYNDVFDKVVWSRI